MRPLFGKDVPSLFSWEKIGYALTFHTQDPIVSRKTTAAPFQFYTRLSLPRCWRRQCRPPIEQDLPPRSDETTRPSSHCVRTLAFPIASDERQRLWMFFSLIPAFEPGLITSFQGDRILSMTLAPFLELFSRYGGRMASRNGPKS